MKRRKNQMQLENPKRHVAARKKHINNQAKKNKESTVLKVSA